TSWRTRRRPAARRRGIVAGVGDRHARADLLLPGMQLLAQLRDACRLARGAVGCLALVLCKVEELDASVLEPLDELPVAPPDGGRRRAALVAVVRVVPVDRPVVEPSG